MSDNNADLTIVIPTYNRPNYLKRHLKFLSLLENPHKILVLDGSSPDIQLINAKNMQVYPEITLLQFDSKLHQGLRFFEGIKKVTTPYLAFSADDDLLVPKGVSEALNYLKTHPEYSCALGLVTCLFKSPRRPHTGVAFEDHLGNPYQLNQEFFVQRIMHLQSLTWAGAGKTGCPPLYYSVKRTQDALDVYSHMKADLKYSSVEMLSNSLFLSKGKACVVNELFLLRDYSAEAIREPIRDEPLLYFTDENLEYIRGILKPILMKNEGLDSNVAEYTLDLFIKVPIVAPTDTYIRNLQIFTKGAEYLRRVQQYLSYLMPSLLSRWKGIPTKVILAAVRANREF